MIASREVAAARLGAAVAAAVASCSRRARRASPGVDRPRGGDRQRRRLDVERRSRSTSGARTSRAQGLTINYQGVGSTAGRQFYIQGQSRLRRLRDPVPGPSFGPRRQPVDYDEIARRRCAPSVRVPADRRRRHVVHVPPRRQRQAGHRPAPLGRRRSPRSSPARSRTGTTPRSRRRRRPAVPGTPDHARSCARTARAPRRSSPRTWPTSTPTSGTRSAPGAEPADARARPTSLYPQLRRTARPSRLGRRRRTSSPPTTTTARSPTSSTATLQARGFPVVVGAQHGRVLRATDAGQRRDRA